MVIYYLFLLMVIFLFGIYNLHWRVKSDAMVYLHPVLNDTIASRWKILLMAGAGVFTGVLLSQEMLEIPRKVIFNPGVFVFSDIMVVFTAMMIADVVLLYIFRSLRISASAIIMVLFELLGSSVAVSLVKIRSMRKTFSDLILFINPEDVLQIIAGIFLSVILAFLAGALVQLIVRFLFTFRYRLHFRRYGILFGAILITLVFYFIMINGSGITFLRETSILPSSLSAWIRSNFWMVLVVSLLFWYLILWTTNKFFRTNTLKIILLLGIFTLALTMTSNEIVNYAGVPLTSLASYNEWFASGTEGELFRVDFLTKHIHTPYVVLGVVGMIVLLVMLSGKTEPGDPEQVLLPVSRNEEEEPSGLLKLARYVTRISFYVSGKLKLVFSDRLNALIQKRFSPVRNDRQVLSYDRVRMTVNLYVSVMLIATATSLKLPLSTVFVVFMVMLGTSLSDLGWSRENTVSRISGIFSFLGYWILTAFVALTLSAFLAWIIIVGGKAVTIGIITLTAFVLFRAHFLNRRKNKKISEEEELITDKDEVEKSIEKCTTQVVNTIITANKIFSFTLESFLNEDRTRMNQTLSLNEELNRKSRSQKNKIIQTISSVKKLDVDSGYFYIQINDYQREIAHSLNLLISPLHEHLENQYKTFNKSQINDIRILANDIDAFFNFALHIVKEEKFEAMDEWMNQKSTILETVTQIEKSQIARIRNKEVDIRNSLLFFKALAEIRNLMAHSVSLIKSYHGFIMVNRKTG